MKTMTNPQTSSFDAGSGGQGPIAGKPPRSGVALASLILGFLGCVPLASLVAVVLGVMGIAATKGGKKSGRGFAVFGIVLGLVGMIAWSCSGVMFWGGWSLYSAFAEPANVTHGFLEDLSANRAAAAAEKADGMAPEELEGKIKFVKDQGGYQKMSDEHWTMHEGESALRGTVIFGKGSCKLEADLKLIAGKWKLLRVTFVPPETGDGAK
jgi:hypothetical protein